MNKVLIIGPNYFNYLTATDSAFKRMGWSTYISPYDNPIHPYTSFMKWRWKLSNDKASLQQKSRQKYNTEIIRLFDKLHPDIVFIMNGDILETKTLDYFMEASKVALWLYDSRDSLPLSKNHIDHVHAMFCYDQDDVNCYHLEGKKAFFLPQACDTDTYKPLGLTKDIDILFIGNLLYSKKRQSVTKTIIDNFPNVNIQIYGLYKPWYKGFFKCVFRRHKSIYKNRNVSPSQANTLYNRSKIVLNIHQEQQKNGANPRVFEICGSKSYQLCDANPYIESLFPNGEIGIWHSTKELCEMISNALLPNSDNNSDMAYCKVLETHTFDNRIKSVIDTLYN